jgi:hypothetical protein
LRSCYLVTLLLITAVALGQAPPQKNLPLWAYPDNFSQGSGGSKHTEAEHLPGSKASYTRGEIGDIFVVPDWYPDAHPPMPEIVAHGRKPDVPELKGSGNVPSIAGRSPSQMARQIIDFQDGARNGSTAPMMKGVVSKLTLEDIVAITGYLASQTP